MPKPRSGLLAVLVALVALGTLGARPGSAETLLVTLPGTGEVRLVLEPARVFAAGATLTVESRAGARRLPLPATRWLAGGIQGEPGSLAIVAIEPDGRRRGRLVNGGRGYLLVEADGRLVASLAPPAVVAGGDDCAAAPALRGGEPELAPPVSPRGITMPAAVIAVETDWELYDRFGSTAAVVAHVGDLFATIGAVYRRDLGADLMLGDLFVWADPADPFVVESDFLAALYELGDHWHADHLLVPRATVHFVSGKSGLLGGVAYHGVLCRADTQVNGHWGGGYSLTGAHGLYGDFRDSDLFAHELGHNFRAYHTHCFNDLPLPGDPEVDRCRAGEVRNDGHACWAGPESMPPDGGSIMSYCHLLGGGYDNITLSLGRPGAFGERSERVVERMWAHVQSVGCLVPSDAALLVDGFETGDTGRWSLAVP